MTSQVRQIKEATDIVAVIGERVSLQRAGANYRGLCPFHSEKSPSFFVSEQMQRYTCFGCGEKGDVFEFLQKYDGMSFYEVLQSLADKAGITLEKHAKSQDDDRREKLLEVLDLAKEYYHYLLTDHEVGEKAREYLKNRGTFKDSIKLFRLGYSMDNWEGLINYLNKKKKYPIELLAEAGLAIKGKNNRYYDRFRDRLMFPLTNHRGQTVGFSGRLLSTDPQAKEAKYINTPETLLYHKSELLYGLSQLYQFVRKERRVVVVEGEFDAISSSQVGVNNVVAIKGSALTEEHAKLLRRTVDVVLLALDTDSAGVTATKKAIQTLRPTQIELRVVQIPDGKDPDDLIKTQPQLWRDAVKASVSAYEFLISVALNQHNPNKPEGKRAIMQELGPVLATLDHAVELEHYVKQLAQALNVQPEIVKQDLERSRRQLALGQKSQAGPSKVAAEPANPTESKPSKAKATRQDRLEKFALFLLLQSGAGDLYKRAKDLSEIDLTTIGAKQVLAQILKIGETANLETLRQKLPEDLQQKVFNWYAQQQFVENTDQLNLPEEWRRILKDLKTESFKARRQYIADRLSALDRKAHKSDAELAEQDALLKELALLNSSTRPK